MLKTIKNWLIKAYNVISFKDFNRMIVIDDIHTYTVETHKLKVEFRDGRIAHIVQTIERELDPHLDKLVLANSIIEIENDEAFTTQEWMDLETMLEDRVQY